MDGEDKDKIIKNFIDELPPEVGAEESKELHDLTYNREKFVFYKEKDIANDYEITDTLGEGSFGIVLKGIHKQTGQERAMKVIPRSKITKKIHRFVNEVNTLKKLDHPNVIRLYEVYETETDVILVQELCKGGELMERFESYDTINEHKVANVFKQILMSIEYCHQNTIVHRDLKPENFMFTSQKEDAKIKLIDFGLATSLDEQKKGHKSVLNGIKSRVGTIIFMAPEVIKQDYNYKCDLWSAGVILYILICGYPPFYGDTEYDTISKILDYDFNFDHDIWNVVTPELKDLINHLLVPQDERYNAEEALSHEWITKHEIDDLKLSQELPNHLNRIKKFQTYKRLKKVVLTYFCTRLQDSKLIDETEMFEWLDKNNDGVIGVDELKSSFGLESKDLKSIVDTIDTDKNGVINYTEWVAAAKDWKGVMNSTMVMDAFNVFDLNSDGKIGWEELKEVLGNEGVEDNMNNIWKEMVDEVDLDGDGKIQIGEFVKLFESKLSINNS